MENKNASSIFALVCAAAATVVCGSIFIDGCAKKAKVIKDDVEYFFKED